MLNSFICSEPIAVRFSKICSAVIVNAIALFYLYLMVQLWSFDYHIVLNTKIMLRPNVSINIKSKASDVVNLLSITHTVSLTCESIQLN